MFSSLIRQKFLIEQLVKRNFTKKYKRTLLGIVWSVLNPLLQLLVMKLVFSYFFGRNIPNYTTFLFSGLIIFDFYSQSTSQSMSSLVGNVGILKSVNISKYVFLIAQNIEVWINFILTFIVFLMFCAIDNVEFTWKFLLLTIPIMFLTIFNLGVGMILSILYIQFKDIQYLYGIFLRLLMYMSAIFYNLDIYPESAQKLFLLNPIYVFIQYFRLIVLHQTIPSVNIHLLMIFYTVFFGFIGAKMYRKYNKRLFYYV
jgi:ABC-2 type transport system permease protein